VSRFWRRLLGFVLLLVLLLVLGLVIERWRGRRILAATVAELKARGALPAPEELFAPPGPSNGIHLLTAAAGRLRNASPPWSMTGVAPGRAAESFRLTSWDHYRNQTNTWDTFAAWGAAHAADLDQLHRALAMPECRATLDWRQGSQMLMPHLAQHKFAAIALAADALLAAHEGDKVGVLANFEALRSLEQHLAHEPILISQLVRIACAAIALPRAWDVAQREDWTEADLAALQAALPTTECMSAVNRSFQGERVFWEHALRQLTLETFFDPGGFGRSVASDLALPGTLNEVPTFAEDLIQRFARGLMAEVLFPLWRFAWQDQAIAFHMRAVDDFVRRCEAVAATRSLQQLGGDPLPWLGDANWYDRLRFAPSFMLLPALENVPAKALRLATERALIETGIALRRHQLRHGRLPERLEQLVPGFLSAVPVDGMDGRPLRYRVNPDGTYALWSVGEDFTDHGGDFTPLNSKAATVRWWNAKDAVLPLRASDAEFAAWQAAEEAKRLESQRTAGGTNTLGIPVELMRRYGLLPAATNAPAP
jgi:hypothetical protein